LNAIVAEHAGKRPDAARHIAGWLNNLARLVRRNGEDGSAEQIALYVEMFMGELPPAAFNNRAMRYIADGCEWWPAYSPLLARLKEHWASEKIRRETVKLLQIAGPAPASDLTGDDAVWRDYWHRREVSGWARGNEILSDERERASRRAIGLSMVRQFAPGAFHAITGKHANPPVDHSGWSDVHALRRTMAEIDPTTPVGRSCANVVRAAVKRHAPQNMAIVVEVLGAERAVSRRGESA